MQPIEKERDIQRAPANVKMTGGPAEIELEEPLSPATLAHMSIVNMTTTLEIQAGEYAELRRQIHGKARLAVIVTVVNVVLTTAILCWIGSYLTTIQSSLDALR